MALKATPRVIKPLVADEIYTDREEFLEFFYNEAHRAATRRSMSTVLLGRRRMGKTEIFKRVVNRLFFEQDPSDPLAAVPVYYSFLDAPQDPASFAKGYLENFIQYYVGFYTRQPEIIRTHQSAESLIALLKATKSGILTRKVLIGCCSGTMPFAHLSPFCDWFGHEHPSARDHWARFAFWSLREQTDRTTFRLLGS